MYVYVKHKLMGKNMVQILTGRPEINRQSVHPSITEQQISELVETFYGAILQHPQLAPIFKKNVEGNWDFHLDKMKTFWRSVLLRTGEYKGKPVPAHQKIEGLSADNFETWLTIFIPICEKVFKAEAAVLVIEIAKRIATSLWLARSNDIFAKPPTWSGLSEIDNKNSSVKSASHEYS